MIGDEVFQEGLNILLCWRIVLVFLWTSPSEDARMSQKKLS